MHAAIPPIASRARSGSQSNSGGGGAVTGGAFTGIPRSAADAGAVKANKLANRTAKMPRMGFPFSRRWMISNRERTVKSPLIRFRYKVRFQISGVAFRQRFNALEPA